MTYNYRLLDFVSLTSKWIPLSRVPLFYQTDITNISVVKGQSGNAGTLNWEMPLSYIWDQMIVLSSICSRLNLWDKPNTIINTLVSFLWTDKNNAAIHLKMEKVKKEAETDQGMDASLMNLAWGSYRAYISVHVSLTLFLCARPMGSNEMAMILVLLFWFFFLLLVVWVSVGFGFVLCRVAQRF